jgi:SdrD B-like domain
MKISNRQLILIGLNFIAFSSFAQVSGKVFRDISNNAIQEIFATFKEPNVAGIRVNAYAPNGNLLGTALTASNGTYSIPSATGKVRIEFSALPPNFFPTRNGSQSNTLVQFVDGGSSANLGICYPGDFCPSSPNVAMPCYVNGDPLLGGTSGQSDALVAFKYAAKGVALSSQLNHLAIASQIGATWGVAYQRGGDVLFTSALTKRYVGFGSKSTSGLYVFKNANGNNNLPTEAIDLSSIGINAGTDPHVGLLGDKILPAEDRATFDAVGKSGFGDIDISDDGKNLYIVNLFDRSLYRIFIDNPYRTPTSGDVTKIGVIPNPNCSGTNNFAPWALKYSQGKLYVGVVCTAQASQSRDDLKAAVYEYNPSSNSFAASPVISFPLKFPRGTVYCGSTDPKAQGDWLPWQSTLTDVTILSACTGANGETYVALPQPILSNIEFDDDGSMILGFMDRFGHQSGRANVDFNGKQFDGFSQGDIYRAAKTGANTWILESNATSGAITTIGKDNQQGPGGGEYYWKDITVDHQNSTQGALAFRAGSGEVLTTIADPQTTTSITWYYSGGIRFFDNLTGDTTRNDYKVYDGLSLQGGFLGKANGLGDLELMCKPQPIEIGNRVWKDEDYDGIQDANEIGIEGVVLKLYNENDVLVAKAITNSKGEYYFNDKNVVDTIGVKKNNVLGPQPNTQYKIRISKTSPEIASLELSPSAGATNTEIDSNGTFISSTYEIPVLTKNYGENEHSFDIGLNLPCKTIICTPISSVKN